MLLRANICLDQVTTSLHNSLACFQIAKSQNIFPVVEQNVASNSQSFAPHFKMLLVEDLNELDNFVSLLDEKKGQMDLHIRFWNEEINTVCTTYYTSEFMGKVPDILKMFKSCMTGLNDEKMLQVSIDGSM